MNDKPRVCGSIISGQWIRSYRCGGTSIGGNRLSSTGDKLSSISGNRFSDSDRDVFRGFGDILSGSRHVNT